VLIGWLAYRWFTRGEKGTTGIADFAQL